MSEQSRKRTERSRMYRRRLDKSRAVSPVVATLILILIAVAAAAALYLWLVSFQGGVTKSIGNPGTQCTLEIGGSTTVYPLTQIAITQFEQNNSGISVCAQQGGSTAGILSLCQGQGVDIAASSSYQTAATLSADGCPNNIVQTTIGLDAAVAITDSSNPVITQLNGLTWKSPSGVADPIANGVITFTPLGQAVTTTEPVFSFNQSTLDAIYSIASTTTPIPPATVYTSANWPTWMGTVPAQGTAPTWSNVAFPAGCLIGQTTPTTTGVACQYPASAAPIKVYERSDNSGTEDGFATKLLGITCGSDHQLQTCDINVNTATGNPGMITAVNSNAASLGFASYGFTTQPGAGVSDGAYLGSPKNLAGTSLGAQDAALLPTVANTQAGYSATASTSPNSVYAGWRVLEYVTIGTPSGEAEQFINFVSGTQVNLELTAATGYVSLYQS
jgi:flagellin-like protein